jgi:hypothetical protein
MTSYASKPRQTLQFRSVFAPLRLDSEANAAKGTRNPARGVLAPPVFVCLFVERGDVDADQQAQEHRKDDRTKQL